MHVQPIHHNVLIAMQDRDLNLQRAVQCRELQSIYLAKKIVARHIVGSNFILFILHNHSNPCPEKVAQL